MYLTENFRRRLPPYLALLATVFVSGCSVTSFFPDQNFALVSGAAIGGTPAVVDDGATEPPPDFAIGALKGGVIGTQAGLSLTENERQAALKAEFEALEYSPAGHAVSWRSPSTGNGGEVTAFATYDVGKSNCRRYTHKLNINGKTEIASGAACKEQDGTWQPLS